MADLIAQPRIIMAAGNKPKQIAEYVGRLNSGAEALSIARMVSPPGWSEPGQTPDFDEYTLVLSGLLRVRTRAAVIDVNAGQAIAARKGEWVPTVRQARMARSTSRYAFPLSPLTLFIETSISILRTTAK